MGRKPGIGNAAVSAPTDDHAEGVDDNDSQPAGGTLEGSVFLRTCSPITHAEVTEKLKEGGYLRAAVLEAQDDGKQPKYAVFLLVNWRKGYCVLHVHWPARPRLYRDLDRLLVLIRFEYRYTGTVALKRASDTSGEKRHWRVTL